MHAPKIQDAAVFVVETASTEATRNAFDGLPWPVVRYRTVPALLEDLPASACGCVVANVESAGSEALGLFERLRAYENPLALILVCDRVEVPEAVAAMRAGVHDVLQAPVAARSLRQRINVAMESVLITNQSL